MSGPENLEPSPGTQTGKAKEITRRKNIELAELKKKIETEAAVEVRDFLKSVNLQDQSLKIKKTRDPNEYQVLHKGKSIGKIHLAVSFVNRLGGEEGQILKTSISLYTNDGFFLDTIQNGNGQDVNRKLSRLVYLKTFLDRFIASSRTERMVLGGRPQETYVWKNLRFVPGGLSKKGGGNWGFSIYNKFGDYQTIIVVTEEPSYSIPGREFFDDIKEVEQYLDKLSSSTKQLL